MNLQIQFISFVSAFRIKRVIRTVIWRMLTGHNCPVPSLAAGQSTKYSPNKYQCWILLAHVYQRYLSNSESNEIPYNDKFPLLTILVVGY